MQKNFFKIRRTSSLLFRRKTLSVFCRTDRDALHDKYKCTPLHFITVAVGIKTGNFKCATLQLLDIKNKTIAIPMKNFYCIAIPAHKQIMLYTT